MNRKDWRLVLNWHIAETREKAREQSKHGLFRHNNEYSVGTLKPGEGTIYKTPDEAVDDVSSSQERTAVIGTPDDLIEKINDMIKLTGGFGCVIGFVHDWANRQDTLKSWDLVARYVIPEVNGLLGDYRESNKYTIENRETWLRAGEAVLNKIQTNEKSAKVLETEGYTGEKTAK